MSTGISIGDNIWYLRSRNVKECMSWILAIEHHKLVFDSGYTSPTYNYVRSTNNSANIDFSSSASASSSHLNGMLLSGPAYQVTSPSCHAQLPVGHSFTQTPLACSTGLVSRTFECPRSSVSSGFAPAISSMLAESCETTSGQASLSDSSIRDTTCLCATGDCEIDLHETRLHEKLAELDIFR
ncbi:unnamed protein product [Protopolystoma xenopodis]|uniref:PH domain-containing protein n=1 Tax=Protopolystoma xenopodis TaxID=117903 RepID=A0A448XAZ7_9PLAT|nr:unnamed protein product [Protopolystoma xenopodis]